MNNITRVCSFFLKFIFLLNITVSQISLAAFVTPKLSGPVNDQAQIISSKTEASLTNLLFELKKNQNSEIAILTVNSLGNESIEDVSIKVTDAWRLGTELEDKGVLILVSMQERKIRIEVGQGLEGTLTDGRAARIIKKTMSPLMKSGDYESALIAGLFKVIQYSFPELDTYSFFNTHLKFQPRKQHEISLQAYLLIFILLLFLVLFISKNEKSLQGIHPNGGFGGSSGGFNGDSGFGGNEGFGGGGSFGGGGGGFSGGGASGGW